MTTYTIRPLEWKSEPSDSGRFFFAETVFGQVYVQPDHEVAGLWRFASPLLDPTGIIRNERVTVHPNPVQAMEAAQHWHDAKLLPALARVEGGQ